MAVMLDKIQINFLAPRPAGFQTENHLIDDTTYWSKTGTASWDEVVSSVDDVDGSLWINKNSTYHGHFDKISEEDTKELTTSLYLIRPDNLRIQVGQESQFRGGTERKVRALFRYNELPYKLTVTDPAIERAYFRKDDGIYPIREAVVCISLSKIIYGHAFKLAASIITRKRVAEANR